MLNRFLILSFCLISLTPCFSKGKKEDPEQLPDQKVLLMETPQKVGDVTIDNGMLSVQGDSRDIAFSLDNAESLDEEKSEDILEEADTYTHAFIQRPDGPIDMVEFIKDGKLLCWVGDGVRANMGPKGLKILPDEGVDSITLTTNGKSWSASLKKETPIVWNNEEYVVFVSKIKKGSMQDQPSFSVDLVIMHK